MNNFEERYTAWLDGALDAAEREKFEAGLPDHAAARVEATEWAKLRGLLRETIVPAPMPHADFLNSQVLAAIHSETPKAESAGASGARNWFSAGRLAWAGAFLLAVAAGLSFVLVPRNGGAPTESQFISQVVDARSSDPKLGAYAFAAPGGKGAVLWVTDAGFIPANERIK